MLPQCTEAAAALSQPHAHTEDGPQLTFPGETRQCHGELQFHQILLGEGDAFTRLAVGKLGLAMGDPTRLLTAEPPSPSRGQGS